MEIRDLRVLVAVVETRGMTRASERLHVVQSAVSQSVQRLERELQVPLVIRRPDGVRPTEAGLALLEHAYRILSEADRAREELVAFAGAARGTVRLGLLPTAAPLVLGRLLARLVAEHPGISLHLEEALAPQLVDRLGVGRLDVIVLFLPADASHFPVVKLGRVPLQVTLPAGTGSRTVSLAALKNETWISFPPANPGREWLHSACAKVGFEPRIGHEVENLTQAKAFIAAGFGLALMPAAAAEPEVSAGLLGLAEPRPAMATELAYFYDPHQPSRAVAAVRSLLESSAV
ncbi:MAG: LysR family transcriptional regulator [Candidatus Dormibacter sp.]|uniref:LysR family transcriptional regulator n=1 Tax=Candidatus Dormibacter sp. TaxID=2973982 RepID=UPI003D9AC4BC